MAQSYSLQALMEEILRTGGAAQAGRIPAPTRQGLEQGFKAVASRAAHRLLGEGAWVEILLEESLDDIRVFQRLRVVESVRDPVREISLDELRAMGEAWKDRQPGDTVPRHIQYHHGPNPRLDEELLHTYEPELWSLLTEELTPALRRYFPAPPWPEGTLGSLLAGGGGWTRGMSARSGDWEVIVEGAFLEHYPLRVTSGWVEYGFLLTWKKGGEVLGTSRPGTGSLPPVGDGPRLEGPARGDPDSTSRCWAELPTGDEARPGFQAALGELADALASGHAPTGATLLNALLVAAVRPPRANGAWRWMEEALPRLLEGAVYTVPRKDEARGGRISRVYPPALHLMEPGVAFLELRPAEELLPPGEAPAQGARIPLGSLGAAGLDLRAPTPSEAAELERIVEVFRDWLGVHLEHHFARRPEEDLEDPHALAEFQGHFALVELLGQRLGWGPPGPPPVPPLDDAALHRAAHLLRPIRGTGDFPLASFELRGWTLTLRDDPKGAPFGSHCRMELLPPEGGEAIPVLMVDAWNPPARAVVDGDAFAFRRFLEWLRGALLRSRHDSLLRFEPPREEDEEEEREEPEREELKLSDWLLFGLPDCGDRFLVDWRAQWHVVNATAKVEDFAGLHGFSGALVERLRTRDIALWRRFLREVVDPRFGPDASQA